MSSVAVGKFYNFLTNEVFITKKHFHFTLGSISILHPFYNGGDSKYFDVWQA